MGKITARDLKASRESMRGVLEGFKEMDRQERLNKCVSVNNQLKHQGFDNISVKPYRDPKYGDVYGIYLNGSTLVETIRQPKHVFPYLAENGIS